MPARRRSLSVAVALVACALAARADEGSSRGERSAPASPAQEGPLSGGSLQARLGAEDPDLLPWPSEGDAERLAAIRRGLDWLATRQQSDSGGMSVGASSPSQRAPLAVTSLSALAWMSGGSTLTRGEYQKNVRLAIEYLLANTQGANGKYPGYIVDASDPISRTHGHGLATLALAQAYTVSPNTVLGKRIGLTLELAVERIRVSQGGEGGWEYDPFRSIEHEGSVTVALVQALRAANDVGIRIDPKVVSDAVEYVRRLQVMEVDETDPAAPDGPAAQRGARRVLGGFRYGLNDPSTSVALTAAGLVTLQATGIYSGPRIDEGYDYIWRKLAIRGEDGEVAEPPFPYYERFYLSQALWHHRDTRHYRRWAEPIMRELVADQKSNGSWADLRSTPEGVRIINRYGSEYATANNVLFLALPDDTLPLFHR